MLLPTALQEAASGGSVGLIGAGLAIGGSVIGAGLGIGPIGSAAASGIAPASGIALSRAVNHWKDQGGETQDGGGGGHENGTESVLSAPDDGRPPGETLLAVAVDVVDKHDAVVDHDAEEDEKAVSGVSVKGDLQGVEADGHAGEGETDREHDCEGVDVGLEERGHNQVDQQGCEDHGKVGFALFL